MLIQTQTFKKPHNGIPAGTFQWFTSKSEAATAAIAGTAPIETTPDRIWRAQVA